MPCLRNALTIERRIWMSLILTLFACDIILANHTPQVGWIASSNGINFVPEGLAQPPAELLEGQKDKTAPV